MTTRIVMLVMLAILAWSQSIASDIKGKESARQYQSSMSGM